MHMLKGSFGLAACLAGFFLPVCAWARSAEVPGDAPPPASAAACTACIPKLTPVEVVIDAEMGSKLSTTGAAFPLRLAQPIVIDGREIVPAGTLGTGEVVHAKKAGGAGAAGELVLAARFLDYGGRRIRLRSMRIAVSGKDAIGAVDGMNAAAAGAATLTPLPLGFIGFAITGRNIVVPKGTVAMAKTAEDFALVEQPASGATVTALPDPAGSTGAPGRQ